MRRGIPSVKTWRCRFWVGVECIFEVEVMAPTKTLARLGLFDEVAKAGLVMEWHDARVNAERVTWSVKPELRWAA